MAEQQQKNTDPSRRGGNAPRGDGNRTERERGGGEPARHQADDRSSGTVRQSERQGDSEQIDSDGDQNDPMTDAEDDPSQMDR